MAYIGCLYSVSSKAHSASKENRSLSCATPFACIWGEIEVVAPLQRRYNFSPSVDSETYETFDLDIPEELKDEVIEGANVLYWIILDSKVIKQVKTAD